MTTLAMRQSIRKYKLRNPEKVKQWRKHHQDLVFFGGNREKAIQRDGEQCVTCRMTRKEHYKHYKCDLAVDHIDHNGRYSKVKNNTLENLQTLCLRCHGLKDTDSFTKTSTRFRRKVMLLYFKHGVSYRNLAKQFEMSKSAIGRVIWCCDRGKGRRGKMKQTPKSMPY